MITASHNPPIYNGFKFKESFGGSARPSTTKALEEIVRSNIAMNRRVETMPIPEARSCGLLQMIDMRYGYLRQLERYVDLETIRRADIPAVVDPMYGAGAGFMPLLVPGSVEIHGEENPSFGGRPPEPTEENLAELSALVKKGNYQVGLAFDGDADRIGAVDENGAFFSSHCIFTILLRHLYERKGKEGGVVKTVSTTRMIELLCERFGLDLHETPIGFKHICELMLENDILMGGEESGGLGVKGHIPERDGILMGLLLLEAMAMSGKGLGRLLSETMDEIGHFSYRRLDLPIEDRAKERLVVRLKGGGIASIAGRKVEKENFRDGFKFIFSDGSWLLIRPSGTEPVLRLYSEASQIEAVEELLAAGREIAGV
jgi:phosphomannomutase